MKSRRRARCPPLPERKTHIRVNLLSHLWDIVCADCTNLFSPSLCTCACFSTNTYAMQCTFTGSWKTGKHIGAAYTQVTQRYPFHTTGVVFRCTFFDRHPAALQFWAKNQFRRHIRCLGSGWQTHLCLGVRHGAENMGRRRREAFRLHQGRELFRGPLAPERII